MTNYELYLETLRKPFQKLVRLRFLNPDGSTAFVLDNDPLNARSGAFLSSGELHCNLQNGQRRTASVTLSNVGQQFDYSINSLWFGQEVALDEGMLLPNGEEIYFQQGIFLLETPQDELRPEERNRKLFHVVKDRFGNAITKMTQKGFIVLLNEIMDDYTGKNQMAII